MDSVLIFLGLGAFILLAAPLIIIWIFVAAYRQKRRPGGALHSRSDNSPTGSFGSVQDMGSSCDSSSWGSSDSGGGCDGGGGGGGGD